MPLLPPPLGSRRVAVAQEVTRFAGLVRHDRFDRMLRACAHANQAKFLTSETFVLRLELEWVVATTR